MDFSQPGEHHERTSPLIDQQHGGDHQENGDKQRYDGDEKKISVDGVSKQPTPKGSGNSFHKAGT